MDIKKLADSLNPIERKVVSVLDNFSSFYDIIKITGLKDVEVMRALQWLQNKNIIKIKEEVKELVHLDENGFKYLKYGLPERLFLEAVNNKSTMSEIAEKTKLSSEELAISLGVLKSKSAIELSKDREIIISITDHGRHLLKRGFLEEQFLKKEFPLEADCLKEEEKFVLAALRKRKRIVRYDAKKNVHAELTDAGKKVVEGDIDDSLLERLDHSLIKSGLWKGKKFRRFDVQINVPPIFGGRKQHYRRFLDEVRQKFIALGFCEMTGPIVETNFWNMDALFMPQIARCFRYDVVDAIHLPDFNQVGGFVIEEGMNFGHLKSLLRMFAEEFADTDEIRIKPSYFPFTEPSAELQAKHPEFGWIELAGSGIFRPELVKPLVGKEIPVIAWGVGLDRLAMFKLGIRDIRQLFSHDLEFLRNTKVI